MEKIKIDMDLARELEPGKFDNIREVEIITDENSNPEAVYAKTKDGLEMVIETSPPQENRAQGKKKGPTMEERYGEMEPMKYPQPEIEDRLKDLGIITKVGRSWKITPDNFTKFWDLRGQGGLSAQEYAYGLFFAQVPAKLRRGKATIFYKELDGGGVPTYWVLDKEKGNKKSMTRPKRRNLDAKKNAIIGIHALSQLYADPRQPSLFSDNKVETFIRNTRPEETKEQDLLNKPDSYGMLLTPNLLSAFMAITKVFSDTNYLGDERIEKTAEWKNRGLKTYSSEAVNTLNKPYKNIEEIPVIKIPQADIIRLSRSDRTQEDKMAVIEAIATLGTKQFCFYWTRLKKDSEGNPVKNKAGEWAKEEVMEVGTLFRIKYVRDENTKELLFYEISPSAVILDQITNRYGGNYFLPIPKNWMDEVKQLTGKTASTYTYRFLLWLRLQFEQIRRYNTGGNHKDKKPMVIKKTWEEVAVILKMPESMYKANRKRAKGIIKKCYEVGIRLGYLERVEDTGATDILYLNERYYPKPGELV